MLRGAAKIESILMAFGVTSSNVLKTAIQFLIIMVDIGGRFSLNVPCKSTVAGGSIVPSAKVTDAVIVAFPGLRALTLTDIKSPL